MYKCNYFQPYELVPKEVYDLFLEPEAIYGIFDENALRVIDLVREWSRVGLTVNNWFWNGNRSECGFRTKNSRVGAARSAHKLGKAFDIISTRLTAQELWDIIERNKDKLPCKIRIEKTNNNKPITWLHIGTDVNVTQKEMIYYFNA